MNTDIHRIGLLGLPNELVMYILVNFLDLKDLWCLYQASSELRIFASTVIRTTWKIDIKSSMKVQCRTALIALQEIAKQIVEFPVTSDTKKQAADNNNNKTNCLTVVGCNSEKEQALHQKIISGISSYKHKYVLIEDIDIRNRIRTAVDLIFHHAVFVSAIIRCRHGCPLSNACSWANNSSTETRKTNDSDAHRALAVVMVRLLIKLDASFPSYCREITYTLADNIKAFLEYTGYKLLANQSQQTQQLTLHSISACFDLMGAAFVGKILGDNHVDCAVQRTCELLGASTGKFKSILLTNLLDNWLVMKREVGTSELCRYIKVEIEKNA
ncbi:hypothetical protein [Parasitella parasitica]|uniref:Uncharacterized protein n=1 Tax=Parasitella parasitica TaxID=35722 RepID=A0A0B7NL70_9FUNG|nr:hypothetical protein [Parasitella parasitica]